MASAWGRRLRSKAKAELKKASRRAWKNHLRNADRRRQVRRVNRQGKKALVSSRATTSSSVFDSKLSAPPVRGSFWARYPMLADLKDGLAVRAHGVLDRRDLRAGSITDAEFVEIDNYDSQQEWLSAMWEKRRESYRQQLARSRDADYGPLYMAYGGRGASVPQIKHVGFRPPAPRLGKADLKPVSAFAPPSRRTVRRRRPDRVPKLAAAWRPQLVSNGRAAMAADGDLNGAAQSVQSFAEQFPETRTQIHDHLGKMAEFGKAYAAAMETFISVLANGTGDTNPGLPPEVLQHMKPLTDVGETIQNACHATVAAWEDYFADAIRAAQDEYTPSKQALTS